MNREFSDKLLELTARKRPFALATVIAVRGSASARPGAKAIIDENGRNVHGWVGGGCAESLVREEALAAIADRGTRIITADLDDEVLGVGMPCGGMMDIYIEPVFPKLPLLIAGHNRLAAHLAAMAGLLGFAVTVHGPKAAREDFPTAERVVAEEYDALPVDAESFVVVATQHVGDKPALACALKGKARYIALVANPKNADKAFRGLREQGFSDEAFAQVHTPAGLDLRGSAVPEIALSILAEMVAWDRQAGCRPLRELKAQGAPPPPAPPPMDADATRLVVVGHGRIAEAFARLGAMLDWPVTVNSPGALAEDYPAAVRVVTDDLDFSRLEVTPQTNVVVATQHKGDHLSIKAAVAGNAGYIGLIASRKRAGLVLDFLADEGMPREDNVSVHAPAGIDLGAVTPEEIALSVISEIIALRHGGSGRSLRDKKTVGEPGGADGCRGLFD